jgi:hypothetical protein
MTSNKLAIAIFFITICNGVFGQGLNKIQREYFLLGTLNDYMGRSVDPRDKNLVDRYDAIQGPLVNTLDSILKLDYPNSAYRVERYTDSKNAPLSFKIFSDTLFKKLNKYYIFKQSGSFTSDNNPQLNNRPILVGALKTNVFHNDSEKLAFLAGTYVRFGLSNDTAYEISIANSYSKAIVCYHLLTDFKCKATYQVRQNYIPTGFHVYFHPNAQVKAYLQNYIYLRKRLDEALNAYIQKIKSESRKKRHPNAINKSS